jgi:tetratricopeptide (TPR) repeat protein
MGRLRADLQSRGILMSFNREAYEQVIATQLWSFEAPNPDILADRLTDILHQLSLGIDPFNPASSDDAILEKKYRFGVSKTHEGSITDNLTIIKKSSKNKPDNPLFASTFGKKNVERAAAKSTGAEVVTLPEQTRVRKPKIYPRTVDLVAKLEGVVARHIGKESYHFPSTVYANLYHHINEILPETDKIDVGGFIIPAPHTSEPEFIDPHEGILGTLKLIEALGFSYEDWSKITCENRSVMSGLVSRIRVAMEDFRPQTRSAGRLYPYFIPPQNEFLIQHIEKTVNAKRADKGLAAISLTDDLKHRIRHQMEGWIRSIVPAENLSAALPVGSILPGAETAHAVSETEKPNILNLVLSQNISAPEALKQCGGIAAFDNALLAVQSISSQLLKKHKPQEAAALLEAALAEGMAVDAFFYERLGECYQKAKAPKEAMRAFGTALAIAPQDEKIWKKACSLARSSNDKQAGVHLFKHAPESIAKNILYLKDHAKLWSEANAPEVVFEIGKYVESVKPCNEQIINTAVVSILRLVAENHNRLGNINEAVFAYHDMLAFSRESLPTFAAVTVKYEEQQRIFTLFEWQFGTGFLSDSTSRTDAIYSIVAEKKAEARAPKLQIADVGEHIASAHVNAAMGLERSASTGVGV